MAEHLSIPCWQARLEAEDVSGEGREEHDASRDGEREARGGLVNVLWRNRYSDDARASVLNVLRGASNPRWHQGIDAAKPVSPAHENPMPLDAGCAMQGEIASMIAHQWKQPLGALGLVLQNMRYDNREGWLDAASINAYLERAQEMLDRMAAMIDDFRRFHVEEAGTEEFALLGTLHKCADLMGDELRAHGISLRTTGEEVFARGRENEFFHVMMNLVANAKDALIERAVPAGRIEMVCAQDRNGVWAWVYDNAGGIAEDQIGKIFESGFTTKQQGSGIGLYLARIIIEQHMHGSIRAENWQAGARFSIHLPCTKDAAVSAMQ